MLLLPTFRVAHGQRDGVPFHAERWLTDSIGIFISDTIDTSRLNQRLDSGIVALNKAIDSIYSLVMAPGEYHLHASELYERFDTDFLRGAAGADDPHGKVNARIERLKAGVERKNALLDSLLAMPDFFDPLDIKSKLTLQDAGVGHPVSLPDLPDLRNSGLRIPGYDRLPSLEVAGRLGDVEGALQTMREISGKTTDATAKLKVLTPVEDISTAAIESVAIQQLPNTPEGEAILNALDPAIGLEEGLQDAAGLMIKPEVLKEKGLSRTKKKFVDHLAGHEDKISSEIQSMEKLQKKYHSVTDVRYLPKRRTNPENGKPFVERLIFGTGFQVERNDTRWTEFDIAPYAGYRFSDRFRAGIGGTYRVAVDVRSFEVSRTDKTYGYRVFGDYRVFNGLFVHLEAEVLKTTIPAWHSNKLKLTNAHEPLWVPMAYIGIMKSYRLGRRFSGQTLMLYDFLAVSRNFDFNRVSFRFGFEYNIQKRKHAE